MSYLIKKNESRKRAKPGAKVSFWMLDPGSQRPSASGEDKAVLLRRFLETEYANMTLLANFLKSHPKALDEGILNQLHRRHIYSWDDIRNFVLAVANARSLGAHPGNAWDCIKDLVDIFEVKKEAKVLLSEADPSSDETSKQKLATDLATKMCGHPSNLFVGPAHGNSGTDLDLGRGMSASERTDLLKGGPYKGIAFASAKAGGWVEGVNGP